LTWWPAGRPGPTPSDQQPSGHSTGAPFEWSSWGDEVDYPVLFGTTQATWGQIDLRFELLTGEVDPDRIARVFVVPFIGTACVVIGFEHGGWDQQAVAWSQARASR
jgi:hypothetical protein